MNASDYWTLIHAERARLVDLLNDITPEQWAKRSLCSEWTVEQVLAHLSAAANTGRWAWIRGIVAAGFNTGKHNDRLLGRYLGSTPATSLAAFERSVDLRVAPTKDYAAFLGEVIVHGQDIARPLGLTLVPDPKAVLEVARFFAAKDFAVNSRTLVKGLSLKADDADFSVGDGPLAEGPLLDLVLAMAGRPGGAEALDGDGGAELFKRMSAT